MLQKCSLAFEAGRGPEEGEIVLQMNVARPAGVQNQNDNLFSRRTNSQPLRELD